MHNYERICPVYKGKCQGDANHPEGTVHFVIGMGGQSLSFDWANPGAIFSYSIFISSSWMEYV